MRIPSSVRTVPVFRAAGLGAVLTLLLATSCQKIPEGVGDDKLGSVHITVVDQNGAPVSSPNVVIQETSGATVIQKQSGEATPSGIIDFDSIQEATLQVWADPPDGYSGGGQANAVTFTIVVGSTVNVTVKLVKNP